MSESRVSALQLQFLNETFDLVKEEFEGIMLEGASDYVLTTGAQEAVEEAHEMVQAFLLRLEADKLEEFEDEPTD